MKNHAGTCIFASHPNSMYSEAYNEGLHLDGEVYNSYIHFEEDVYNYLVYMLFSIHIDEYYIIYIICSC